MKKITAAILLTLMLLTLTACGAADTAIGSAMVVSMSGANAGEKDGKTQADVTSCTVELDELKVDELLFCSILSNALDNALNAQKLLPAQKCSIRVMIKVSNEKLLLSVKNPIGQRITFADGLPVTGRRGHGYGTQSIRYMTAKLGGMC